MNQKALSFFFSNYDFKDFDATNADQGFIENHLTAQYAQDEQQVMRLVRRMVRELSGHPDLRTDFMFDAGGHEDMWRRLEGYRINLIEQLVMKVTVQMGEDAGTYVPAQSVYAKLAEASAKNMGKRFMTLVDDDGETAATRDLDYAYLFSQIRNLVSQLSASCVFKVEEQQTGLTLTIMPLTEGLAKYNEQLKKNKKKEPEGTGTFIKIQLRHVE